MNSSLVITHNEGCVIFSSVYQSSTYKKRANKNAIKHHPIKKSFFAEGF